MRMRCPSKIFTAQQIASTLSVDSIIYSVEINDDRHVLVQAEYNHVMGCLCRNQSHSTFCSHTTPLHPNDKVSSIS